MNLMNNDSLGSSGVQAGLALLGLGLLLVGCQQDPKPVDQTDATRPVVSIMEPPVCDGGWVYVGVPPNSQARRDVCDVVRRLIDADVWPEPDEGPQGSVAVRPVDYITALRCYLGFGESPCIAGDPVDIDISAADVIDAKLVKWGAWIESATLTDEERLVYRYWIGRFQVDAATLRELITRRDAKVSDDAASQRRRQSVARPSWVREPQP